MTQSTSFIGLFCEDIREEKSGQDTIIGVLPDNLEVPTIPVFIPKLAVYFRANWNSTKPAETIALKLMVPNQPDINLGNIHSGMIEKAKQEASAKGMPYVGLILKSIISPLHVQSPGKIFAIVTINGSDSICGVLNIIEAPH